MYTENDLFFPHHLIPALRTARGDRWRALCDAAAGQGEMHAECLALVLTMVRLNGCVTCETDSFRAMRGCAACALQTLRRYKGSDDELIALYETALHDVRAYAAAHGAVPIADRAPAPV